MIDLTNVIKWHGVKAMKAWDNLRFEKNHTKREELWRAFFRHTAIFDKLEAEHA